MLDATAQDVWRILSPPPHGFEDGTRDFLGITQLQFGFKQLEELGGINVSVIAGSQGVRCTRVCMLCCVGQHTHTYKHLHAAAHDISLQGMTSLSLWQVVGSAYVE